MFDKKTLIVWKQLRLYAEAIWKTKTNDLTNSLDIGIAEVWIWTHCKRQTYGFYFWAYG